MKKQALAIAIASAMAVPSAFAAQDTSGMHYTSASEGFYASIRAVWSSSGDAQDDFDGGNARGAHIGGSFSRFGIRGTNDLGGGLEGFYQYEARVDHLQNATPKTRLASAGLRGNFGEIVVGSFWNNLYSFTYGTTDVANNYSGHFLTSSRNNGEMINTGSQFALPNRSNNAIQYTTPDLSGFQGSFIVVSGDSNGTPTTRNVCLDDGNGTTSAVDGDGNCPADNTRVSVDSTVGAEDRNDVDGWGLAGKYDVQGFSVGASYINEADGRANTNGVEDETFWSVKLGYAQDNWYVNGWYGEANNSDTPVAANTAKMEDTEYLSIAGGVSIDKVNVYIVYEQSEQGAAENTFGTVGVQYNLGSRSRTFVEYNDQDTNSASDEGSFLVGLRHDF